MIVAVVVNTAFVIAVVIIIFVFVIVVVVVVVANTFVRSYYVQCCNMPLTFPIF